jgi:hypothetical protein
MSDQLRENGSADIHPPIVPPKCLQRLSPSWPFSVQIVFGPNPAYSIDGKGFIRSSKALYRTAVH